MDFKEFKEKFNPLILNESEVGLKQLYVPNTWPEAKILLGYPNSCIWTLLTIDEKVCIKPGLHFNGRICNIITANCWQNSEIVVNL